MTRSKERRFEHQLQHPPRSSKLILQAAQSPPVSPTTDDDEVARDAVPIAITEESWPSLPGTPVRKTQDFSWRPHLPTPGAITSHGIIDLTFECGMPHAIPRISTPPPKKNAKLALSPIMQISLNPTPARMSDSEAWAREICAGQPWSLKALVADSEPDERNAKEKCSDSSSLSTRSSLLEELQHKLACSVKEHGSDWIGIERFLS